MSKYSLLLKDTFIFGIGNFTTKLIYFFLMPIYTLCLSTYDFGIADLLNNSLQLIIPILTLSISDAVFRFSLDKGIKHEALLTEGLRVLSWSYLIVGIFMGCVVLFNLQGYWYFFALLYVFESLKTLLAQFTRGLGLVREYATNGIIAASVLLVSSYIFLKVFKLGINGYILAFIIANIAALIYMVIVVDIKRYVDMKATNKMLLRSMIAFSLPLTPNMLSWWITNISSRYILACFSGLSISGLFAAASKLPALINVISSIFQLSWQFASVREYQETPESSFYSTVLRYYTVVIFLIGSLVIGLIPYISMFLLKGDYYEAWIYTPLLLMSAILGCFSIFFGTFYSVVKNNRKAMTTTIIGSLVNLIGCLATIPFMGVWGAILFNVISYVVIVWLRIKDIKNIILIKIDWFLSFMGIALLFLESLALTFLGSSYRFVAWICPAVLFFLYRKLLVEALSFVGQSIKKK